MRSTSGAAPFLMAGITFKKLRIVTNVSDAKHDKHVLLIRLSALGDVVHTLPAAALLRKKLPNAKLTWIVEAPFVELLQNNPAVDEVLVFPKKLIAKELKNPLSWLSSDSELRKLERELKSRKFTAAVDFQGLFKSGVIALLSGAPVRVGFSEARELSPQMMTHRLSGTEYFSNNTHVVDHNLDLAEFYLRIAGDTSEKVTEINFSLPEPDAKVFDHVSNLLNSTDALNAAGRNVSSPNREVETVEAPRSSGATGSVIPNMPSGGTGSVKLRASRVISQPPVAPQTSELIQRSKNTSEKLIVLIPGTTWITKIWPKEKWSRLVSQLVQLPDVRIVLVGGTSEVEMNRYIYDSVSNQVSGLPFPAKALLDLTGKTSLADLIALFMVSDIVVGADTGPLHMAAATGTPRVIGVFGSTPWKRNGPVGVETSVVALDLSCQPCFEKTCPIETLACLKDLDVESVFNEITKNEGFSENVV